MKNIDDSLISCSDGNYDNLSNCYIEFPTEEEMEAIETSGECEGCKVKISLEDLLFACYNLSNALTQNAENEAIEAIKHLMKE